MNQKAKDEFSDVFGEPISVYTRANAIDDGLLVDVTSLAKGYFKIPVCVTDSICRWLGVEDHEEKIPALLSQTLSACLGGMDDNLVSFKSNLGENTQVIWAEVGPGDDARPVLTIMFPEDR
jgi:hypothetical protein